jgi:glycosyltransferase involved in cell wall biosynthesis
MGATIILAVTAKGRESREFRMHLEPIAGNFEIDASMRAPAHSANYRATGIREFQAAVARHKPQRVLVPLGDGILPLLGIYASLGRWCVPEQIHVEFALIRANFSYPARSTLERARFWAKELAIAAPIGQDMLLLIDPVAFENIRARGSSLAGKIRLVPEPLDDFEPVGKAEARRRLGIPENGRYIGCTGLLDTRKGIDHLIRGFAAANLAGTDRLLLAGVVDKEVAGLVGGKINELAAQGRFTIMDRYLSDEELNLAICAMDVVAATYWTGHRAPSGIVNRAAVMGRHVLASRFGWSDFMVPEFGLGTLTDVNDPKKFANDIAETLERSVSFVQSPKTARLREFLSPANFAASWTANIAQHLGHPMREIKTWEWVRSGTAQ